MKQKKERNAAYLSIAYLLLLNPYYLFSLTILKVLQSNNIYIQIYRHDLFFWWVLCIVVDRASWGHNTTLHDHILDNKKIVTIISPNQNVFLFFSFALLLLFLLYTIQYVYMHPTFVYFVFWRHVSPSIVFVVSSCRPKKKYIYIYEYIYWCISMGENYLT